MSSGRAGYQKSTLCGKSKSGGITATMVQGLWSAIDAASDDARIAGVARLPEAIADDGEVTVLRDIGGGWRAAQLRAASQQGEEAVGDQHAFHLLRTVAAGERDVEIHRRERREAFEGAAAALPLGEVAVGDFHLLIAMLAVGRPEHGESAGIAERQRVQQHAGDHAEDGRIGAECRERG